VAIFSEDVLKQALDSAGGFSATVVCYPLPFATKWAPDIGDVAPFMFKLENKGRRDRGGRMR
jgi:hypothetical protein